MLLAEEVIETGRVNDDKSRLGRGLDGTFSEKSVPSKSGAKDTKEKTASSSCRKPLKERKKKNRAGPVIVKISKVEPNHEHNP